MNKPSFTTILVTAFLMPVTNGIAWSDDASSNADTAAAAQRQQLPTRGPAPVHYPPPPNPGWHAGPWGSPPAWAIPPRGYRQPPPGNRTDVELDRLREEREANRAQMDKAREELRRGEIAMQEARAALDRALSEHQQNIDLQHTLGEQLTDATAENVALQSRITQLTTELAAANTSLAQTREQVSALTGERDQLQNTLS